MPLDMRKHGPRSCDVAASAPGCILMPPFSDPMIF